MSELYEQSLIKLELDRVLDSGAILGWLQAILKWLLVSFHKLIPNYGVAIILLTIVVKIVLYPLTKKSFESSAKMSALSPKMKEIQVVNAARRQAIADGMSLEAAMEKYRSPEDVSSGSDQ